MPCMCGDICCPSCGPAQGNWKCPICHQWASEGCDHIDPDSSNIAAPFVDEVERLAREEAEREAKLAEEEERLLQEYWKSLDGREQ